MAHQHAGDYHAVNSAHPTSVQDCALPARLNCASPHLGVRYAINVCRFQGCTFQRLLHQLDDVLLRVPISVAL